jgi:hypothetical protein
MPLAPFNPLTIVAPFPESEERDDIFILKC